MYGSRARPSRDGLPIITATGRISSPGAIRGSMTSRGDLRHSITADGFPMKGRGAGCQPRHGLRALTMCVLYTRLRWWPGSEVRISQLALQSAEGEMHPAAAWDGSRWARAKCTCRHTA